MVKQILSENVDAQWKHEAQLFMRGLRTGNYEVTDDTIYVRIFKRSTAENDPRYVYFKRGGCCLYDDHFYMQKSPRLSNRTINVINNRAGWRDGYEDEY